MKPNKQILAAMNKKAKLAAMLAAGGGAGLMRRRGHSNRRPSPVAEGARAQIEEVVHPLFDTETISDVTTQVNFFARPRGAAAVAGNTKTTRDTNLETAGQLSRPKVQVVTGIRVIISMITGDGSATPAANIPDFTDYATRLRALLWEALFSFSVGPKTYLEVPVCQVPGNVGLGLTGWAGIETPGGSVAETEILYSLYGRGDYFSLLPSRVRIPSLQTFAASISWPVAATNSVALPLKATVCLDGLQGREVM